MESKPLNTRQALGQKGPRVRTYTEADLERELDAAEKARAEEARAADAQRAEEAKAKAKAEAKTGKKVGLEEIVKSNPVEQAPLPKMPANHTNNIKNPSFEKILPYLTGLAIGGIIGESFIRNKLGISEIPAISGSLLTTSYMDYLSGGKIFGKYENKPKEDRTK
jgi:hypothetical protein